MYVFMYVCMRCTEYQSLSKVVFIVYVCMYVWLKILEFIVLKLLFFLSFFEINKMCT